MENMRSVAEFTKDNPVGAVDVLYSLLMQIPDEFVMPAICTALDQWFADHDFTEEEALNAYRGMAEAAEGCYKLMGMSPKTQNTSEEA